MVDVTGTQLKVLKKDTEEYNYWASQSCYSIDDMAQLIAGIIPVHEIKHKEEKFYNDHIAEIEIQIRSKVERVEIPNYNIPDYALYGFGSINHNEVFTAEAYRRFCYNNNLKYPFDDSDVDDSALLNDSETIKNKSKTADIFITKFVTVQNVQSLIDKNQELGDILESIVAWYRKPNRTRESLKELLDIRAKAHKWGWEKDKTVTDKQLNGIIDVFLQSNNKRIGNKEPELVVSENKK